MRRIIFYLFYDANGVVDEYVAYKLRTLREHADHIFVVSNGPLTEEGRATLESVADDVWQRRNVGFDVWAYKEAMEHFGWDRIVEYDELILMNYTFFGPIYPWAETFERMDPQEVDFWGLTAHKAYPAAPFRSGLHDLPLHIQSHWIAVRQPMLGSHEFRQYWDTMPMIESYDDSVLMHEARFTKHFADRGFSFALAFPPEDYPSDHPVFESVVSLLEDRCPILKRRMFFHDPFYLERNAILGKRVIDEVEKSGYPLELIWPNVARSTEPRVLYTNFSLLTVTDRTAPPVEKNPVRVAVLAHIYYPDMVDELMSYIDSIPRPYDLIVTTPTQERADAIEEALSRTSLESYDVRIVDNQGRDMAGLFVGCRDILMSDDYDLICRVHSKKSPQDASNAGNMFKHHLLDNILGSPAAVTQIIDAFVNDPSLGMMFPPIVHIAYPTMGHSWFHNRVPAERLANELGITIPFDTSTPLAPYGSMFWARPEALRLMAQREWRYDEFPEGEEYRDGSLTHVMERLLAYAALSSGYYVRCVINPDWAAINYTLLEYKLQALASRLPHLPTEQLEALNRMRARDDSLFLHVKESISGKFPRAARMLGPTYRGAGRTYRRLREQGVSMRGRLPRAR